MTKAFAYIGNEAVGEALERSLRACGYARTGDFTQAAAVFTYCTSQTALEDVYFDEGGLVQNAKPGTLLIDLSAATPSFSRELNAVAVVSDLIAVEAPLMVVDVTRDDAFADKDNLACFVGGDEDGVEVALPLLEAFVGTVQDTGGAGSAQLARAAYTLQATAQIIAAVEADALYRAFRGSAVAMGEDLGRAGGATPVAEQVLAATAAGRFEGTYTVEMFMAELSAALTAADDLDLILPQAEACLHLLELLAVIGGADKAPSALSLVYGEEAACAEQGLDWTRAEQTFGDADDFDEYDDACGCGHDHDHDHAGYPGFAGPYGTYSAN